MAHCKCKTNKGTYCKHPSNPNSTRGYCSQHDAKKKRSVSRARPSPKSRSKKSKSRSKKSSKKYRFAASLTDKLMSKLEEIRQVAIVKTEINNLIEEIPKFLSMNHEQREKARDVVAARAKEHATISGLAFKKFYEHENIQDDEACRYSLEKVENRKERKGEQRTYPQNFFHDGDQLQTAMMDDLASWIGKHENIEDVKDDLLTLLDSYKDVMQSVGELFWIKLMTDCLNGL
jgi:hypothetical protein